MFPIKNNELQGVLSDNLKLIVNNAQTLTAIINYLAIVSTEAEASVTEAAKKAMLNPELRTQALVLHGKYLGIKELADFFIDKRQRLYK